MVEGIGYLCMVVTRVYSRDNKLRPLIDIKLLRMVNSAFQG